MVLYRSETRGVSGRKLPTANTSQQRKGGVCPAYLQIWPGTSKKSKKVENRVPGGSRFGVLGPRIWGPGTQDLGSLGGPGPDLGPRSGGSGFGAFFGSQKRPPGRAALQFSPYRKAYGSVVGSKKGLFEGRKPAGGAGPSGPWAGLFRYFGLRTGL